MSLPGRNLAGSSDDGRPASDFYPTPAWATQALLAREEIRSTDKIWEPAAGDGAMVDELTLAAPVIASDIEPRRKDIFEMDFLNASEIHTVDHVITNPPFKLAQAFIEKSKQVASKKIAMFLKIQFLEGITRLPMFLDKEFPLARIYVFSRRVSLTRDGKPMKNGGTMCFAWFVWDRLSQGQPIINWIDDGPPKNPKTT